MKKNKEAKDLLIRAIFEITTYASCFRAALNSSYDGLADSIFDRIKDFANVTKEQILNAKINKIVLAPKAIINELAFDFYKNTDLSEYQFLSIEKIIFLTLSLHIIAKVKFLILRNI